MNVHFGTTMRKKTGKKAEFRHTGHKKIVAAEDIHALTKW